MRDGRVAQLLFACPIRALRTDGLHRRNARKGRQPLQHVVVIEQNVAGRKMSQTARNESATRVRHASYVNDVPRLWGNWDEQAFNFSREGCFTALRDGDPSIVPLRTPMGVTIVPWMMVPGQEAQRGPRDRTAYGARPARAQRGGLTRLDLDSPMDVWDPARAD